MSQQLLHYVYKEPRNGEEWSCIVDLLVHYYHEASLSARTRGMACSYLVVSNRTVSQLLLASISPTPQFDSRNMSQRAPIYRY